MNYETNENATPRLQWNRLNEGERAAIRALLREVGTTDLDDEELRLDAQNWERDGATVRAGGRDWTGASALGGLEFIDYQLTLFRLELARRAAGEVAEMPGW